MTSRQRVKATLNHQPVDRVVVDLGGMHCSGAHVSIISQLRQSLGLDRPGDPVKVWDPYQMLGEIGLDLIDVLQLDIVLAPGAKNMFGFENADWKPWTTFDGTNVLVPGKFNIEPDADGNFLQYPQGDKSAPPSGRMPKGGYYFDTIIRQDPIDDAKLNPADNLEEFTLISNEDLDVLQKQVDDYYANTNLAIAIGIPGAAFGDVALVPAPFLKYPKGIRDIEEWYISTITRKDYMKQIFAGQAEIALQNLALIYQAVGDKVQIVNMDGTDLASQDTLFCSPDSYRELYLPYAKKLNDWIHGNTPWKAIKHCCGACEPLISNFIEAGYDILNPVQCSATGMEPQGLVDKYGEQIVFWGGGIDTQKTLPFGSLDEVKRQVAERVEIFRQKNGFVFNTVHNIQCNTPIENVRAMFESLGRSLKHRGKK
jgi:hypothetical protein